MESDNCYGQSSDNILPNFLGSILELLTSTCNILILMICGAQFRNELIEILRLRRFFPTIKQQNTLNQQKERRQRSRKSPPLRVTTSLLSSQNGCNQTNNIHDDPSMDSILMSLQNKDDMSMTEIEQ